jgi:hypothetical protein
MHKTPEITRLIHENFWTVLSFAFGRPIVSQVVEERFLGEWKFLNKTVHGFAEVQADRALLAMATQIRVLDDAENVDAAYRTTNGRPLGEVIQADDTGTPIYLRDMTNKIMHAALFKWDFSSPKEPRIICISHDQSRWKEAYIDIVALMGLVGMLMY